MATEALTPQAAAGQPPRLQIAYETGLTGGDDYIFANDGKTRLLVKKGAGTASVLTFTSTKSVRGLAVADPTVTVPVTEDVIIGPFEVDLYGVEVAVSNLTNEGNVSLAVLRG